MQALRVVPAIHYFDTFREFAEKFKLGKGDIIITNEWMYDPYVLPCNIDVPVIYQEKYGVGEPTDKMMDAMKAEMDKYDYDRIIAFGGGTIIDCCKVLSCSIPTNAADLYSGKIPLKRIKKLIAVPTTCGTGSEVTNVAVASISSINAKKGIADEETYADAAVLIPEPLGGLPDKVFATSSADALIHAAESFLSPKSSPFTELYSMQAIRMIINGYKTIINRGGNNPENRKGLLKTSYLQQIMPVLHLGTRDAAQYMHYHMHTVAHFILLMVKPISFVFRKCSRCICERLRVER